MPYLSQSAIAFPDVDIPNEEIQLMRPESQTRKILELPHEIAKSASPPLMIKNTERISRHA